MVFGGQDDRTHTGLFGVPNPLGSLGFNVSRWIVDRRSSRSVTPFGIQISIHTIMQKHSVFPFDHGFLTRRRRNGPFFSGTRHCSKHRCNAKEKKYFFSYQKI